MKKRVYIETSVISYLTARPSRDIMQVARQAATEQWWREHRLRCETFVSELVDFEIEQGDDDASRRRHEAIAAMTRAPITSDVGVLAKMLFRSHALPSSAEDDAFHVALASVHEMDILLTWNCKHIANVIMMPKILATIQKAGFEPPMLTTPANLLESLGES